MVIGTDHPWKDNTPMKKAYSRRLPQSLAAVATAVIAAIALCVTLVPTSAAASQQLRPGKGYAAADGDFVGFYLTSGGTKVYCLSPRKTLPSAVSLGPLSR